MEEVLNEVIKKNSGKEEVSKIAIVKYDRFLAVFLSDYRLNRILLNSQSSKF